MVKQSKIITQQLQAIKNPEITDIKISYCKTFKNFTYNIQDYEAGFDYKVLAKVLIALDIIKQV